MKEKEDMMDQVRTFILGLVIIIAGVMLGDPLPAGPYADQTDAASLSSWGAIQDPLEKARDPDGPSDEKRPLQYLRNILQGTRY